MGIDFFVACPEAREYVALGKFYEQDGIQAQNGTGFDEVLQRLKQNEFDRREVYLDRSLRILAFLKRHSGKKLYFVSDDAFSDLRAEIEDRKGRMPSENWFEYRPGEPKMLVPD